MTFVATQFRVRDDEGFVVGETSGFFDADVEDGVIKLKPKDGWQSMRVKLLQSPAMVHEVQAMVANGLWWTVQTYDPPIFITSASDLVISLGVNPNPPQETHWCEACRDHYPEHYDDDGNHLVGAEYGPTGEDLLVRRLLPGILTVGQLLAHLASNHSSRGEELAERWETLTSQLPEETT